MIVGSRIRRREEAAKCQTASASGVSRCGDVEVTNIVWSYLNNKRSLK